MVGSIWATIHILSLPEIGGLANLVSHENVVSKLSLFPDLSNPDAWIPVLFVPLAVQWWASYYPGSEPGGGGYIAQRMFSAKDESHAIRATFLFNIAHYGIRPWPWILIALSSLIIFPELSDIQKAFPDLPEDKLGHDIAYPAMLTLLPSGLLGIVSASLIAAFMSTMSTQLNLGASYLVNDFYFRFIRPDSSKKELVNIARVFTTVTIILGAGLGLILKSAGQAFNLLLMIGAGTGLIYILRWFWWRINAYTEITAMASSLLVALYLNFSELHITSWVKIMIGVSLTTIIWVLISFITPQESEDTLQNFVDKVNPGGPGWKNYTSSSESGAWFVPKGIFLMALGCTAVYGFLLSIGHLIYGNGLTGILLLVISFLAFFGIYKTWK